MNIQLLIRLKEIQQQIEYIIQINDSDLKKQYLRRLSNELKQVKRKINQECKKDGHYYNFSFPSENKYEIKKCTICGNIQKKYVQKKNRKN